MFLTQRHVLKTNLWYVSKNDPKVNDNSVDENPGNELCESTTGSETIDENNVILPRRSTRARKSVDRYGAVPYM